MDDLFNDLEEQEGSDNSNDLGSVFEEQFLTKLQRNLQLSLTGVSRSRSKEQSSDDLKMSNVDMRLQKSVSQMSLCLVPYQVP